MELGLMSNSKLGRLAGIMTAIALLTAISPLAHAAWEVNMPRGVTAISQEVYGLHMLIFIICCVIALVVFGAMFYSILRHRKSLGAQPASFSHSTKAEILWTIVPCLILIGMAVPAADTLIRMEDTRGSDLSIKATGYQWKWGYEYIDEGFGFFSSLHPDHNAARQLGSGIDPASLDNYLLEVDKPLVVPVGAKVRLLLTSSDVIHAWWVPDFGGKKDAIPGFVNEFWFKPEETGIFRGQCAELCGRDHGFMPIVVKVVSQDEYEAWRAEQMASVSVEPAVMTSETTALAVAVSSDPVAVPATAAEWSLETAMASGESLYNANCGACHQIDGKGMPPTFPAIAGSAVATGDVDAHIEMAMNGKPGTAMAGFGPQLSDEQLAAIVTYQRNAFGNDTGELVSPDQIAAHR
jgi:cytochrome c oxidase subunit 2